MTFDLLGDVVGIDEGDEVVGEGHGETDERRQLSIMSLTDKNVENLSKFYSPIYTQTHKVLKITI